MQDFKTAKDRLSGYKALKQSKDLLLKSVRIFLLAWLLVMPLLVTATILTHHATAVMEYKAMHSFKPVH